MTTDPNKPVFRPPFGGAETYMTDPREHHGYRHMVAWNISLGATSRTFILGEIEKAKADSADPEVIYQVDETAPQGAGQWITLNDLKHSNPEAAQRVEAYVKAMLDHEKALLAYKESMQPPPPRHDYTLTFPAKVSVTVQAPNLAAAWAALTPDGDRKDHEIRQADPHIPGTMRVELDRKAGVLVATDDPTHQPNPARRVSLPA